MFDLLEKIRTLSHAQRNIVAFGVALLFSGSLYALALTGIKPLGAITPLGGVFFLLGWGWIALKLATRP